VRHRDVIGRSGAKLDEIEALYRSRLDVFARVAVSVTGDPERARDAVQEAFATAVQKRGRFRGEGPLEAWIWRMVLNAARSDVRRKRPAVAYDEPTAVNGRPEEDAELRAALARLPERQRTALFLRRFLPVE
jgi:RNA polymerase sigma-70 factor (ECF subfamily)